MDQLMQKLLLSKKIMEKSDQIKGSNLNSGGVQNFNVPNAKYNIPNEILEQNQQAPTMSSIKPPNAPSVDAIKNSKLPDNIKKLMIEHPIEKPNQSNTTISNELVERASRLMKDDHSNNYTPSQNNTPSSVNNSDIKSLVREAVQEVLSEYGFITESEEKTKESFNFKVGKHIFEGKITKIKKLK